MGTLEYDFVIPLSIDGLQESSSPRQYSVAHVSTAKEVPQGVQECIQAFRKEGPKFILDQNCFDIIYSTLVNFKSIEEETLIRIWELMMKVMTAMVTKISTVLDEETSQYEEKVWLLTLKMNTYLACNLTEAFESNYNKPSTEIVLAGKKGKRGPKRSDFGMDWEEERTRMLVQLFSLIQLPLNRLWDPPVMDEDYVNLIANCCYKILETSSMNLLRTKAARDSIFQIVGTLVKRFSHGLACSLKLMQLLQHFEHLVSPVAQGVVLMMETYDAKGVLQEMIREVVKIDTRDMAKDSSGLRNFAQFFIEIGERCPHVFIPSLSLIVTFLQQEAYSMRNCVLSILGSIVLRVLKGETLDSKSKALRDECLSYLRDFIHDCHAFVRSKVLQIWVELIEGQAVPLTQQQPILKMVVQRLRDRSSNVRRYALHLLAAFLKANPFAAKLPLEDLKQQFEKELEVLKEMRPDVSLDADDDDDDPAIENSWSEFCPTVIKALKQVIKDDDEKDSSEESEDEKSSEEEEEKEEEDDEEKELLPIPLPLEFSVNDGVIAVGESLSQDKAELAIRTLQKVIEQYPNEEVFQVNIDDGPSDVDRSIGDLSKSQREIFVILHRIFASFTRLKNQMEQEQSTDKKKENEKRKKEEEIKKQKTLCCYLRDSVNFAREIHKGLPDICQLLASRQITDIMEAIDFFVTAFEFGVLNAMTGVRKMLGLIWSKEQTVKDAVVNAYRRLYINVNAPNERSRALQIVRNLSALITGATLGELTSMEEIVAQFFQSGDINKHCITLLWERFTKALPETSDEESKSSLILLSMAANSEVSIISSNLSILIDVGLGERGSQDFSLAKHVCLALCKIAPLKLKTDDPNPPFRLEQSHEMFKRLSSILIEGIFKDNDTQYSPMATEAINTIYLLAEHPDIICGKIIQDIFQEARNRNKKELPNGSQVIMGISISTSTLARFLTIIGHIALRQLIHMDTYIFTELKRRNFLREEQEQKKKKDKRRKSKNKSNITSASEVSVSKTHDGDIDDEMGLTGAVADDMEAEFIRSICDTETVKGDNLLALLRPIIVGVCANPTKYSDPNVRAAAGLALAKFMLVSTECCEENLQLLFTIMEKSKEAVIRANTIIAIGDLTFRFPNLVEPWTPRIYARLRDESTFVRRNTLTVLTHLILNDQVKVKGQISDIALCVIDEDVRIAGMAKLFFNELSKKGNALYNILPDIISRLSDTEIGTEEEKFRAIISHIFGLIQKDRQLESFIEKLCYRLQATNIPRQWRDITYCLSLLPYSEKGIRKLSENFSCYSNKLHEENVYELFVTILNNAKKLAKVETKTAVEELETRLEECHKKGVEDENLVIKALNTKNKTAKKEKRTSSRRKKIIDSDSEESEQSDDSDHDTLHPAHRDQKENVAPVCMPRRSSTRIKKPTSSYGKASSPESEESEDDDEQSSEDDKDEVFTKKKNTRIAKSRGVLPPSSHRKPRR